VDKVGTASNRESYPKLRAMFTTEWKNGPWGVNYKLRYIGETEETTVATGPREINPVFYNDISGSYSMDNGLFVRLGIDNILDEQPPESLTNQNINFDISTYDPIGRFMYAQLGWNFGD
jgi:outer membrane receptor protein involved in Fe transport